jgi:hypothetical protein
MDISKLEEMPTYQIIDAFVRFVRGELKLPAQESGPLTIEILNRTGFDASQIESDGELTKVTQSRNNERATKWLELAWSKIKGSPDLQSAFTLMEKIVEDTRPLKPIRLSEFDEHLLGIEPEDVHGKQPRDEDPLPNERLGTHDLCRGTFNLREISKSHIAIICDACGLRIPISKRYVSYSGLRGRSNRILAKR